MVCPLIHDICPFGRLRITGWRAVSDDAMRFAAAFIVAFWVTGLI
jgi:hypothetical protein